MEVGVRAMDEEKLCAGEVLSGWAREAAGEREGDGSKLGLLGFVNGGAHEGGRGGGSMDEDASAYV